MPEETDLKGMWLHLEVQTGSSWEDKNEAS